MLKLEILNKNGYVYKLKEESGYEYSINIEFLDIEKQPEVGDYIYIHKELLDTKYDGYSTSYTFGNLNSKYGKENITIDDIDVVKVVTDNIEIYLKRLYG